MFHRLRENDPLYFTDFGYWYVSRYDDVVRLLRDTRLTSGQGVPDSFGLTEGPLRDIMDAWMMSLDGPAHTKSRGLVSRAFTPTAVEALRPAVQSFADDLVAAIAEQDEVDILDALAFPLPMEVTRMLFGVDPELWDREITALFARGPCPGAVRRRDDGARRLPRGVHPRASGHCHHRPVRRRSSAPDADGNVLSDLEQVANAVLLVTAGFETTMGHIANAVRTLLLHPDQVALLRADWSLARNVVDEVLRFEPPALFTTRFATVDIEVAGGVIPAGSNVMFSSIAANRDPARYPDPDRFDITPHRHPPGHLRRRRARLHRRRVGPHGDRGRGGHAVSSAARPSLGRTAVRGVPASEPQRAAPRDAAGHRREIGGEARGPDRYGSLMEPRERVHKSSSGRPHVVIVGAGFGGLAAASELADAPVDVTLVDRNNFHTFQPLLYQVATAGPGERRRGVPGPGHRRAARATSRSARPP